MKVQIVTDHLFLLTTFLYGLNLDSKYKWRVKISSFIATICLKGLLINKGLVPNKRQRIPKGQSKLDNPEKLTTQVTQDEDKHNKNIISVGHHYSQTNTNNVNKT